MSTMVPSTYTVHNTDSNTLTKSSLRPGPRLGCLTAPGMHSCAFDATAGGARDICPLHLENPYYNDTHAGTHLSKTGKRVTKKFWNKSCFVT